MPDLLQIGPGDREGPAVFRVDLGGDAKHGLNEPELPDHIALRQPPDLPRFGDGNIAGGGETYRLFDILATGKSLVSGLDIVTDAPGANTARKRQVQESIRRGRDFFVYFYVPRAVKENSFLNAIEILPLDVDSISEFTIPLRQGRSARRCSGRCRTLGWGLVSSPVLEGLARVCACVSEDVTSNSARAARRLRPPCPQE